MAIKVIARLTFSEVTRRKALSAVLILGLLFLVVYALGLHAIQREIVLEGKAANPYASKPVHNVALMSGLYVVNFLSAMITILVSVDTISGEITSGTIHALAAKPVHRWEIILGKWIGSATMLTLYVLLMGGSVMGLIYITTGYTAPNALRGLLLMELNGLLLISVTLWGSTWLSTLANGVLVLVLFGISFVGGWIEQIGALVENQAAVNIGVISSLLLPSDALWRRAAFEMNEPLANLTGFALFSSNTSVPSPAMIGYTVVYTMIFLIWAVWIFNKRDL